ncbi:hypothetical protein EXIGLDRAFT_736392 [Exidia glandulosa HHB12029]|uniref:Uncharacterized protein n=1 Tax=Exidia glandulosa HHB12029 TaxID=1314781 RepID=A0A165JGD2_EXIGL|nr:hypothetical protein EXIGLDRAFT_736392 [Exidia glandulosa HHB12029]
MLRSALGRAQLSMRGVAYASTSSNPSRFMALSPRFQHRDGLRPLEKSLHPVESDFDRFNREIRDYTWGRDVAIKYLGRYMEGFYKEDMLKAEIAMLKAEIATHKAENARLKAENAQLETVLECYARLLGVEFHKIEDLAGMPLSSLRRSDLRLVYFHRSWISFRLPSCYSHLMPRLRPARAETIACLIRARSQIVGDRT